MSHVGAHQGSNPGGIDERNLREIQDEKVTGVIPYNGLKLKKIRDDQWALQA
jgi:hypothetical protein